MPTSIIKACPSCVWSVRHVCRLQDPNRDALVLHARFTGAALDYVLNQLIETRLVTDPDFVAWHDEHATEVLAPNRCGAEARRRLQSASVKEM